MREINRLHFVTPRSSLIPYGHLPMNRSKENSSCVRRPFFSNPSCHSLDAQWMSGSMTTASMMSQSTSCMTALHSTLTHTALIVCPSKLWPTDTRLSVALLVVRLLPVTFLTSIHKMSFFFSFIPAFYFDSHRMHCQLHPVHTLVAPVTLNECNVCAMHSTRGSCHVATACASAAASMLI